MKTVAIGTLKGGPGKTTLVFNIAGVLAEKYKVLVVDFDPQCNLSSNAGVDITDQDRKSTRDIFENPRIDPADLVVSLPLGFDIIPSHIKLTATELQLVGRSAREHIVQYYIEDNQKFFDGYDYILFDTNPSMGIVNQNAFLAADSIVLVSDVSDNGVQGVELFMYLWEECRTNLRMPDNVKALIVNNYDQRMNLSSELIEYCQDNDDLSPLLVLNPIPARVKLKETAVEHKPINELAADTDACVAIRGVVDELFKKEVF